METKNKILKSGKAEFGYLIILALLFAILSGCSNDNPMQPAAASNGNFSLSSASSNSVPGINQNLLQISTAKVLVKELKIYPVNDEENENHMKLVKTGPFVINMDMSSKTGIVFNTILPPGDYRMLKFEIHRVTPDETPPDPDFADANGRYSVVVKGTYNGVDFIYKSRTSAIQKDYLQKTLVVSVTSMENITFYAGPISWFLDENGNVLDPTLESNRHSIDDNIRDNIRNHIRLFIDDDYDGKPDN